MVLFMHRHSYIYVFLFTGMAIGASSQTTNIGTGFNQASAATDACNTTNVQIYGFQANVIGFSGPTFTAINSFSTSGTYVASDILNFKLYRTTFSVFNTTNLMATITTGLGPGTHTFSGFSYSLPFSGGGTATYFWITVDIAASATNGHKITCSAIVSPQLAITGTINYGTNTAGGTQTISCSNLPIELTSFTASPLPDGNLLKWTTATETNNDYFTVERSADATNFTQIATEKGAGNSDHVLQYSASDDEPLNGMNYYRLRQTDYDGHFSFSDIIATENRNDRMIRLKIFPDPVSDILNVKIPVAVQHVSARVCDASGRELLRQPDAKTENGILAMDIHLLSAGIYFLFLEDETHQWQTTFIKQ